MAAPLPQLAVPLLAGAAGESVDSSSLRFLTAAALRQRKEEEEEGAGEEEEGAGGASAAGNGAVVQRVGRQEEEEEEEEEEAEEEEEEEEAPALFEGALVVDSGSGMLAMPVFLVTFLFALCSLRLSTFPRCQVSWPS